jgi:uncharacterized membrane protein
VGLVAATFFFALSLVPSLLPRASVVQGLITGVAVAIGYGLGAAAEALWRFLEIPSIEGRPRQIIVTVLLTLLGLLSVTSLWQYVGWQNDAREIFGMPTVNPAVWLWIIPVGAITAMLSLAIARGFRIGFRAMGNLMDRFMPRRLALASGAILSLLLIWGLFTGVVDRAFFAGANALFSGNDLTTEPGAIQPTSAQRTGSADSLAPWDTLGRTGRNFVSGGPTVEQLNEFNGTTDAMEPIRVYAGLRSGDSLDERATLLLDEFIRTGAFEREAIVVATTTGTGWLDPNSVDTIEYIYNGNVAIGGLQYSYLPSWISLLADQQAVKDTSLAQFRAVHDYWSALPEDTRPDLYLFGLSLGSFGVEAILTSPSIVNEPINGALMVGPTFLNPMHAEVTATRDDGSPAYSPVFDNGRTIRFTGEANMLDRGGNAWGPTRVVYLQHGSDPVTFFNPDLAWSRPAWLNEGNRSPEVTERMDWFPIVTMVQTALDLVGDGAVPEGFGHKYTVKAYADSWAGVFQADAASGGHWTEDDSVRLGEFLEQLRAEQEAALDIKDK